MTVSREMPAGRGVRVVKTVRFDILKNLGGYFSFGEGEARIGGDNN